MPENELNSAEISEVMLASPHFFWPQNGNSTMRDLQKVVSSAAVTDLPILIAGEPGSGRRTLAHYIHHLSSRREAPFTVVSAGVLSPEGLREALEAADRRGTILLHDITTLQEPVRAILMNWVRHQNGDTVPLRVISLAADEPAFLEGEMLHEDWLHRLGAISLHLPPLRERRQDIPELAAHLLTRYAAEFHQGQPKLSDKLLAFFDQHPWPGNVRELKGALKMLLAVEDEDMVISMLRNSSFQQVSKAVPISLKQASRAASHARQRQVIAEALLRTDGNRKRAAKELNISYKALLYKLKQFGLPSITAPGVGGEQ